MELISDLTSTLNLDTAVKDVRQGPFQTAVLTRNGKPGQRSTAQRELLLRLIHEFHGHVDASELYERARERQPRLSLSTVYRNLSLFKQLGIVDEHQFTDGRRYYEPKTRRHHQHLVCVGCGDVFEFNCPSARRLRTKISNDSGFDIVDTEVRLIGYCPKCQRQLSSSKNEGETKQQVAGRR